MRPLDGVTIVELARVLACPFADMILAELGATVIKVEQPGDGDETRGFEPRLGDESAYYFACNRSKQSVAVNLRTRGGQDVVRRLTAQADVVVENFPVGALRRYGLDYQALSRVNARLVYVSCTGFGQSGPYAHRRGYDTIFQAMGGIMSLTGERGGPPVKPGLPVADLASGLWIAIGVLSALHGRATTGRGCHIDFSMLDGQVSLLTIAAARYFATGEVPERLGTEHPGRVPSASFQCCDGRWVHITASDQHWAPLCEAIGLAEWGRREDLQSNEGRLAARGEVMEKIADAARRMTGAELCARCDAASVPAGPLNDIADVLHDPHVIARSMVRDFVHPATGRFSALALPYVFDGYEQPSLDRPPCLGEHTQAVLRDRLGLSPSEIATLRTDGAIE
jgi:crotonobetainyl-CoA:carnitine CoA-transferase CaiB-like acyl-CoA transferase